MSTNIYVGNLAFSTGSSDLERLFAEYGPVTKAQVISDRDTGQSRGFGFVEMGSSEAAQKAIDSLDGALTSKAAASKSTSLKSGPAENYPGSANRRREATVHRLRTSTQRASRAR
jgi:RNA recognition motif-containing protein